MLRSVREHLKDLSWLTCHLKRWFLKILENEKSSFTHKEKCLLKIQAFIVGPLYYGNPKEVVRKHFWDKGYSKVPAYWCQLTNCLLLDHVEIGTENLENAFRNCYSNLTLLWHLRTSNDSFFIVFYKSTSLPQIREKSTNQPTNKTLGLSS